MSAKIKPRRTLSAAQAAKAKADLSRLAWIAGSVDGLSIDAGVSKRQVYTWISKGYISATGADRICKLQKYRSAGFTRENLCPDVLVWLI